MADLRCIHCGCSRMSHDESGCTLAHHKCKSPATERRAFTTFKPKSKEVIVNDFVSNFCA